MTAQQQKALDEIKGMVHLTMTGYYAGTVLCRHQKDSENTYYHAAYCPQFILDSDKVCQECLAIWNNDSE